MTDTDYLEKELEYAEERIEELEQQLQDESIERGYWEDRCERLMERLNDQEMLVDQLRDTLDEHKEYLRKLARLVAEEIESYLEVL